MLQSLNNYEENESLSNNNDLERSENNIQIILVNETYGSLVGETDDDDLKPETSKTEETDNKINIEFNYNNVKTKLKVDPNRKFSDILSEFLNGNNVNNHIAIHNYHLIKKEANLIENNIRDNDEILIINIFEKENISNSNPEKDESEIINFLFEIYKATKFFEYLRKIYDEKKEGKNLSHFEKKVNREDLIKFLYDVSYIISPSIKILEHEHKLICCLTNDDLWECNQCQKKYNCQEEKFYCSLCDYKMCHACRKKKNYDRRKTIKNNFNKENKKLKESGLTDKKNHKLIYCLTSRNYFGETFWDCNKCGKKKNNGWSFYCSICDYDVCIDCFNKIKENDYKNK